MAAIATIRIMRAPQATPIISVTTERPLLQGQHGTAITDATLTLTGPTAPSKPAADSYDFLFRLERGVGKFDGPVANALKVTDLSIPALSQLRGAIQAYGSLDTRKIDVAAGLETRGLHFLPPTVPIPHFVILGLQAGTQSAATDASGTTTGTEKTSDVGMGTYRAFFGFNGGSVKSKLTENAEAKALTLVHDVSGIGAGDFAALRTGIYKKTLPSEFPISQINVNILELPNIITIDDASAGTAQSMPEVRLNEFVTDLRTPIAAPDKVDKETIRQALDDEMERTTTSPGEGGNDLNVPPTKRLAPARRAVVRAYKVSDPVAPGVKDAFLGLFQLFLSKQMSSLSLVQKADVPKYFKGAFKVDPANPRIARMIAVAQLQDIADDAPSYQKEAEWEYAIRLLLEYAFERTGADGAVTRASIRGLSNRPTIDPPVWQNKVSKYISNLYGIQDRYHHQLWLEGAGQYYFFDDSGNQVNRFNNIFAATYTFYFNPAEEKREWFRLRFDNGRDRSQPDKYRNYVTATVGLDL